MSKMIEWGGFWFFFIFHKVLFSQICLRGEQGVLLVGKWTWASLSEQGELKVSRGEMQVSVRRAFNVVWRREMDILCFVLTVGALRGSCQSWDGFQPLVSREECQYLGQLFTEQPLSIRLDHGGAEWYEWLVLFLEWNAMMGAPQSLPTWMQTWNSIGCLKGIGSVIQFLSVSIEVLQMEHQKARRGLKLPLLNLLGSCGCRNTCKGSHAGHWWVVSFLVSVLWFGKV